MNIVNLADGGYVSKSKYDDTVNGLKGQVTELQGQITSRDGDLTSLREQLTAAQADAGKLGAVQQSLADLQTKYNTDKTDYENKLTRQAYEYMVRERANSLQFSSASAKKAFLQEAIGKDFKVDGESLLGYEDFVTKYKADDPGAFAAEKEPEGAPKGKPTVVLPSGGKPAPGKKYSLSELMMRHNENPDAPIAFARRSRRQLHQHAPQGSDFRLCPHELRRQHRHHPLQHGDLYAVPCGRRSRQCVGGAGFQLRHYGWRGLHGERR